MPRARFTSRISAAIHPSLRAALDQLAEKHDRLMSDEVRAAITYHLRTAGEQRHDLSSAVLDAPHSTQLVVAIKPDDRARLDELAARHGRPLAAEMRVAVQRYLERAGVDPVAADPQLVLIA